MDQNNKMNNTGNFHVGHQYQRLFNLLRCDIGFGGSKDTLGKVPRYCTVGMYMYMYLRSHLNYT